MGPRTPGLLASLGRRGAVVLAILAAGALAFVALDLGPAGLVPRAGGARIAREMLSAALSPAFTDQGELPAGARPLLLRVGDALRRTLAFAAAATTLALALGLPLGVLASSAWWSGELDAGRRGPLRALAPALQVAARVLIAVLRSVHELLWAVVLLAAFGLTSAAAVLAIAIPYAGTFAKVFSEIFDEAPRSAARALEAAGARPLAAFLVGTLPRAAPDGAAYAFYRFECAVRSSAVLGFFGFETLGYGLALSFENLHYREMWTYLYVLLALVVLLEAWSAALRRRFVA